MKQNQLELAALRNIYLFEALDDVQFATVAASCHKIDLPAKQALFEAGQPAEEFYLLKNGQLKLLAYLLMEMKKYWKLFIRVSLLQRLLCSCKKSLPALCRSNR